MDRLMPFDELNIFETVLENIYETDTENRRQYLDFLLDEIEDMLILSYLFGSEAANTMLDLDIRPDKKEVSASVNKVIAGKTWRQRVTEYLEADAPQNAPEPVSEGEADTQPQIAAESIAEGDSAISPPVLPEGGRAAVERIMRVVETDSHRVYNEAMWNVAKEAESRGYVIYKRWETMLDDRVRDTHAYLQGEAVPLSEYFYTYDGDYALRPGDFQFPENTINCRCRLVLTRADWIF